MKNTEKLVKIFSLWFHSLSLSGRRVLGNSSSTFRDGVLSQFTWQDQSNGGLDFSSGDGRLLVVSSQLGGFGSDSFEDIVNEGV